MALQTVYMYVPQWSQPLLPTFTVKAMMPVTAAQNLSKDSAICTQTYLDITTNTSGFCS